MLNLNISSSLFLSKLHTHKNYKEKGIKVRMGRRGNRKRERELNNDEKEIEAVIFCITFILTNVSKKFI